MLIGRPIETSAKSYSMPSTMAGETLLLVCALLQVMMVSGQEPQMEMVTGTVYCNNQAKLYVNGELVATDPVAIVPHNAFNVEFQVPAGEPVTLAIEAIDLAYPNLWNVKRNETKRNETKRNETKRIEMERNKDRARTCTNK